MPRDTQTLPTPHAIRENAAAFGMSTRTLHKIVKDQGWGHRTPRHVRCVLSTDAIRPLWEAGLCARDIGLALGASTQAVQAYSNRHGMTRGRGWRPTMTLAQWREQQLAERMAEVARAERMAQKERAA
jgi:hypothetical protein